MVGSTVAPGLNGGDRPASVGDAVMPYRSRFPHAHDRHPVGRPVKGTPMTDSTITPREGDIVRVTYAGVWAPDDGDSRMLLTGDADGDRWHNIIPDNARVEVICAAEPAPAPEPEPQRDDVSPVCRTRDGRLWRLVDERSINGHQLYETRGGVRYTAAALRKTYGLIIPPAEAHGPADAV